MATKVELSRWRLLKPREFSLLAVFGRLNDKLAKLAGILVNSESYLWGAVVENQATSIGANESYVDLFDD